MFDLSYASLYDSMHRESFNHKNLLQSFEARVGRKLSEFHSILDFGCGTGNGILALKNLGANKVVGYDPSNAMIEIARSKLTNTQLFSDFSELKTKHFDLVLSLFDVSNYLSSLASLEEYLKQISIVSKEGAYLFLDSWNLDAMEAYPPKSIHREFLHLEKYFLRSVQVIPNTGDSFTLQISIHDNEGRKIASEEHFIRPWLTGTFISLLERFGFRTIDVSDAHTGYRVTKDTFRFNLLARLEPPL